MATKYIYLLTPNCALASYRADKANVAASSLFHATDNGARDERLKQQKQLQILMPKIDYRANIVDLHLINEAACRNFVKTALNNNAGIVDENINRRRLIFSISKNRFYLKNSDSISIVELKTYNFIFGRHVELIGVNRLSGLCDCFKMRFGILERT